jgi:hypothetical protein
MIERAVPIGDETVTRMYGPDADAATRDACLRTVSRARSAASDESAFIVTLIREVSGMAPAASSSSDRGTPAAVAADSSQ